MNEESYSNFRLNINKIKDTDKLADVRNRIFELYGIEQNTYLFTWVYDNKLMNIFHNN